MPGTSEEDSMAIDNVDTTAGETSAAPESPTAVSRQLKNKPLIIGIAAVALILVAALGWYFMQPQVPNVVGKTVDQATTALGEAGFTVGNVTYDEDAEGAVGAVILQNPGAGERLKKGTAVALTVAGPPPVKVPDLSSLDQEKAAAALGAVGLTLGDVTQSWDASVTAGLLVSQDPTAGEDAPDGSAVAIVISKGPQPVALPVVTGKAQAEATALLEAAGFVVTVTTQDDPAAAGTVLAQDPASGDAQPGSAVTIVVSTGVEMVTVPDCFDLVGAFNRSFDDSGDSTAWESGLRAYLKTKLGPMGLGFKLEFSGPGGEAYQKPTAGTKVPKGTTVLISIAGGE